MNSDFPSEYRDYILIRNLYHCTPDQLDEVDEYVKDMHFEFMQIENKESELQAKRKNQSK